VFAREAGKGGAQADPDIRPFVKKLGRTEYIAINISDTRMIDE